MCWRFFKYKLVLDDIGNKLRRDCEFMKAAIKRKKSMEPEPLDALAELSVEALTLNVPPNEHPDGPYDGPPSPSTSRATVNTSASAQEESATSADDLDSPATDLRRRISPQTRSGKEWIIPCSLAPVRKRIERLLADREQLDGPLAATNDMVRPPLAPHLYKAYNFTSIHEAEFASTSSHNSEYLAILATLFLPISLLSVWQCEAALLTLKGLLGMNIVELGADNHVHWWLVMEIGFPMLAITAILGFMVRRYWTPERRRKITHLGLKRGLGFA
jgi:hypothetical protein